MILFKACPRCGGDLDATYPDEVFCVQCAHRPEAALPQRRVTLRQPAVTGAPPAVLGHGPSPGGRRARPAEVYPTVPDQATADPCPRCGSSENIRLDRLRQRDNTCYRCRTCGHIFSPGAGGAPTQGQATTRRSRLGALACSAVSWLTGSQVPDAGKSGRR